MNVRAVCALLCLAVALPGCAQEGEQKHSILFHSGRDGNFEIYSMNPDGTGQRRLTSSPGNDITPAVSADGSALLFASDRTGNWEIMGARIDGSRQVQLTHGQGANSAPSWTPDGKVLFVSTRDALYGELYLMSPNGRNIERLTTDSLVKDTPVMSPDMKTVFMTVTRGQHYAVAAFSRADGRTVILTPEGSDNRNPAVASDGAHLLFVSNRDRSWQVYMMNADGSEQHRITMHGQGYTSASWTTSDDEILVAREGTIFLYEPAGDIEHPLSFKGDSAPQWCTRP